MKDGITKGAINGGVAKWQNDLRASVFDGVTAGDIKAIVTKLIANAKAGDPVAVKLVFDYVLGGKSAMGEA